jgi:hypothetical protein
MASKKGQLPTMGLLLGRSHSWRKLSQKKRKAHNIAETLAKPCATELVELICYKDATRGTAHMQLSSDTIHDRIKDITELSA